METNAIFTRIEEMTSDEYKNGGADLTIHYDLVDTLFGKIITSATLKGLYYMAFVDDETEAVAILKAKLPKAQYLHQSDGFQQNALLFFSEEVSNIPIIPLHLKGTKFQLDVWKALLKIPCGYIMTYGEIAKLIGRPKAVRAVGTAVGSNPVSILVPCHRVVRESGGLGGYHWGLARKDALLIWEAKRWDRRY
ncbi:MAG: methylated-DNA--[protein]-cysteine S-methyltransferase [Candidatus Symbiothrix sp.]|jgi:AraC family transcriptional regulator of adaptative response/methylated-DNA-[protein]-cysteine methyltransferase|nr:methylated-DNA--[protein]-cysteine S-methyltransferase [Candidatus Symbiothrix sp.]